MTPCPRCRALVPLHARFCSECGTWVVHALTGTDAPMPAPPPVQMPVAPLQSVEYAGTLPASSAMLAAMSLGEPPLTPPKLPTPGSTMIRTLGSGQIAPPSAGTSAVVPVAPPEREARLSGPERDARLSGPEREARLSGPERTLSRASKTIADERPSVAPSVSLGRPPRPLGAFLVSYQYEPLGTFWPLGLGQNLVGRAGTGRPDLDVGISDTTVSSEQALIEVDARGITVEDRASRNGTSVNGRAVAAGARVPLAHGDRVKFGSFETILVQVPYPAGS